MADPEASQDGACGFTQQAWALFLAPLPAALIGQDPKSHRPYVRHQVAVEMLNAAFGVDGWMMEVRECWQHDQYRDLYLEKDSDGRPTRRLETGDPIFREKLGRCYAEALVRLTIGRPGGPQVYREDIGSQIAAADWSEARKGAVSEALKRAAARFGWASEVYKTEELSVALGQDWEKEILPTYAPPFAPTVSQLAEMGAWMNTLGWTEEHKEAELAEACKSYRALTTAGCNLKYAVKTRAEVRELMVKMGDPPQVIDETVAMIVDFRSSQEVGAKVRADAAGMIGGGNPDDGGTTGRRLFDDRAQA